MSFLGPAALKEVCQGGEGRCPCLPGQASEGTHVADRSQGSFLSFPEEMPYLKCPLHTVLKLTPVAYGEYGTQPLRRPAPLVVAPGGPGAADSLSL